MDEAVELYIRDLPEHLTKEVNTHIRLFSITMLITDDEDSPIIPCAGTLSNIKGYKGIITARHVWEEIIKHKNLLIMIGKVPHIVEVNVLNPIVPHTQSRSDKISTNIPDIAFIQLPQPSITHLEAMTKAFYSVDTRLKKENMEFFKSKMGYFSLFGTPEEWINYQNQSVPSFIYNTYISEYFEHEGWDYQIMGINLDANPDIPENFSGVSGGGVWKIKFWVDNDKTRFAVENFSEDIALVGVNFYQTDLKDRQIIAHGPESIYKGLYNFI
jgi:hypothetical protein